MERRSLFVDELASDDEADGQLHPDFALDIYSAVIESDDDNCEGDDLLTPEAAEAAGPARHHVEVRAVVLACPRPRLMLALYGLIVLGIK